MAAAKRIWRYNIEGALIDVPQTYDQRCRVYLDAFPDLIEKPVYTPAGERVLLTIEDRLPPCGFAAGWNGGLRLLQLLPPDPRHAVGCVWPPTLRRVLPEKEEKKE